MSGPYILVDAFNGKQIVVGSVCEAIRPNDALRYQATLIAVQAPSWGHKKGRVHLRYDDGAVITTSPAFIDAIFKLIE